MARPVRFGHHRGMLDSSALSTALKIGEDSRSARFDWDDVWQVVQKVEEEWSELKEAIRRGYPNEIQDELGDVLFTVVQLARHLQLNPEQALASANEKFLCRFQQMKQLIESEGLDLSQLTLTEMEKRWQKVKKLAQKNNK